MTRRIAKACAVMAAAGVTVGAAAMAQAAAPSPFTGITVFGDNVTDKRYRTQVQFNAFGIGAQWSAPATIAVEGGVKF